MEKTATNFTITYKVPPMFTSKGLNDGAYVYEARSNKQMVMIFVERQKLGQAQSSSKDILLGKARSSVDELLKDKETYSSNTQKMPLSKKIGTNPNG